MRAGVARASSSRQPSYGPSVAALVLSVTVYSFASAYALDGVPDSEFALFQVMATVVGLHVQGITIASSGLLLLARVAGFAALLSLASVVRTRMRLAARRSPA